jgi:cytoskeletal protein CcmA (bactofilin family)
MPPDALFVPAGALVRGPLRCRALVVSGEIDGDVHCTAGPVLIRAGARLKGRLAASGDVVVCGTVTDGGDEVIRGADDDASTAGSTSAGGRARVGGSMAVGADDGVGAHGRVRTHAQDDATTAITAEVHPRADAAFISSAADARNDGVLISTRGKLTLGPGARVEGSVRSGRLDMHDGAMLAGLAGPCGD